MTEHQDEEIRRLVEDFAQQSQRGTKVTSAVSLVVAAALGAVFLYAVLRVSESPLADFDSTEAIQLFPADFKKEAELRDASAFSLREESLALFTDLVNRVGQKMRFVALRGSPQWPGQTSPMQTAAPGHSNAPF